MYHSLFVQNQSHTLQSQMAHMLPKKPILDARFLLQEANELVQNLLQVQSLLDAFPVGQTLLYLRSRKRRIHIQSYTNMFNRTFNGRTSFQYESNVFHGESSGSQPCNLCPCLSHGIMLVNPTEQFFQTRLTLTTNQAFQKQPNS